MTRIQIGSSLRSAGIMGLIAAALSMSSPAAYNNAPRRVQYKRRTEESINIEQEKILKAEEKRIRKAARPGGWYNNKAA